MGGNSCDIGLVDYFCGMVSMMPQLQDTLITSASGLVSDSAAAPDTGTIAPLPVKAKIEPAVIVEDQEPEKLPNFFFSTYTEGLPAKYKVADPDAWILPLLLLAFFLTAVLNALFPRTLMLIFRSITRVGGLRLLSEDDNVLYRRTMAMALLIYLIVSPIFVYQIAGFFHWEAAFLPFMPAYGQLFLIGAGLLGLKMLIIMALGSLFECRSEASQYITGIVLMNALLGVLFIPVSLGLKLAPPELETLFMYAGIGLFALLYAGSLLVGVRAGWQSAALSKFHLFLYFCTLEIIPVLLLVKTLKNVLHI